MSNFIFFLIRTRIYYVNSNYQFVLPKYLCMCLIHINLHLSVFIKCFLFFLLFPSTIYLNSIRDGRLFETIGVAFDVFK